MTDKAHWDRVYDTKASDAVSWYAPQLARSLELIDRAGLGSDAGIIDVGGGASTLPTDLLDAGYSDITVLDISASALQTARAQLGERHDTMHWLVGDVTTVELPQGAYDLWHDRAVFHFLTDERQQRAYIAQVEKALRPGGHIIVATFGPNGPDKCSGLPVQRYDERAMLRRFGDVFERVHCLTESHATPWGSAQEFVYCLCRRV